MDEVHNSRRTEDPVMRQGMRLEINQPGLVHLANLIPGQEGILTGISAWIEVRAKAARTNSSGCEENDDFDPVLL